MILLIRKSKSFRVAKTKRLAAVVAGFPWKLFSVIFCSTIFFFISVVIDSSVSKTNEEVKIFTSQISVNAVLSLTSGIQHVTKQARQTPPLLYGSKASDYTNSRPKIMKCALESTIVPQSRNFLTYPEPTIVSQFPSNLSQGKLQKCIRDQHEFSIWMITKPLSMIIPVSFLPIILGSCLTLRLERQSCRKTPLCGISTASSALVHRSNRLLTPSLIWWTPNHQPSIFVDWIFWKYWEFQSFSIPIILTYTCKNNA